MCSRYYPLWSRGITLYDGWFSFVISPTVAELTDEGILGLDFCSLYGAVLDSLTGELVIRFPEELRVQCVLRRVSGVSSVAQTVKIAPRHVCNVLVHTRDVESGNEWVS